MQLSRDQRALHDFMSEISELCYCAGWMITTEYRLWAFMTDTSDDGDWGLGSIPQSARQTLQDMSQRIGGWMCWSEDAGGSTGPIFLSKADWVRKYDAAVVRAEAVKARSPKGPRRFYHYHELFGDE